MGASRDIARVREFNRTVTRRIGALHDQFLGRNRPLGESRLLYEIGTDGADVRDLRARLGIDSGYLSRMLRSLEGQGLVSTRPAPGDARMRRVELTAAGKAERRLLDRRSDAAAAAILAPLPEKQRERLIAAMADVERLLLASEMTIAPEAADSPTAHWCLEQYFELLNERFEGGYEPGNAAPADHTDFSPPNGIFLVAWQGGAPVGCGSLRTSAPGIGEVKRLWVAETARRMGLGQRLLLRLEEEAVKLGHQTIRLDTNRSLTEAQALYLKNDYREVPRFNDDPYPDHWFEKDLT